MRATAAVSEHPIASQAVGEVAGEVLEGLDGPADLAVVFAGADHTGAIEDVAAALHHILRPRVLIGSTASGVIAQDREIEDSPSLALWAATGVDARPIRIEPQADDAIGGWPDTGRTLLLADPFTLDATALIDRTGDRALSFHGGFASAAQGPGGNRLLLDGSVFHDGGVGVDLGDVDVAAVVSQGCRPVGEPFTVTGADRNVITELGSKPPLERLHELVAAATPDERELLAHGLQIGVVIDEQRQQFTTGDFLIRGILGADRERGAIAVGAMVPVGTTVQFHVRDATSASRDLEERLGAVHGSSALAFTCNGRGIRLFGRPHHDAELVHHRTGSAATAGMFCAGELGPVNGRNHVHGFTTSALVFPD